MTGGKGEWRKLHSQELLDLYSSSNIIRPFKKRVMRWGEHVAHTGEKKAGKIPLENLGVEGRKNIKTDLKK